MDVTNVNSSKNKKKLYDHFSICQKGIWQNFKIIPDF